MEELKSNSVSGRDYNIVYASASSGNVDAQLALGRKYRDGDGVEQDGDKAVEWLTKAANQGSTNAKYDLAYIYKEGDCVPLNYSKAIEWFTLAADEGDLDSLVWLGLLHERGHGFPKDPSKAVEYYSIAAAKGDSYGQNNLGNSYRHGTGVPKDEKKAIEWLSKSAAQGNESALMTLGEMYIEQGDYEKGKEYLRRAGEEGNERALEKLSKIEAVQEKHRIEDSVKKITCPFCGRQSVWGQKYCHGCTARILYSPARRYEWIGICIAILCFLIGITLWDSIGEVLVVSLMIWPLSIILSKFFGEQQAFFRKD